MTTGPVGIVAHAKVNLFLRILAREASGYHSIETLFSLLELADEVTVERAASGVELTVDGGDTGPADENLATRAAQLVLGAAGNRSGVRIHLVKRIPVRAGLGGGSSDGAATLHAVNLLLGNPVPRHEILQLASRLGSDVPFFASGAPLALAWGRGERLFRLSPPPAAAALVAVPPFGISTVDAYQRFDAVVATYPARGTVVLDDPVTESWGSIARLGGNDFESVLFGAEPRLRETYERLAETRPLLVRMSGSGSAIVALYKTPAERDQAARLMGEQVARIIPTLTRSGAAPGPEEITS
ncbi:MAG: 4-(cytidine 5'-diphospho)-2-C-methyl-D-erythritol kinase [Gemmatimonadetes bacterium]|nr:4-(cytidine 5'-diphospho)-2-C-methyl-D-erythritol kinase [Gemmatimonadota bacterium]